MSRITFVRHAETDMAGTFCGHSDPELNQRGRAQLASLLRELERHEFQKIFTSDLKRARQTAQAIAVHFGVEVCERHELREIYFGAWEGLSWNEIEARDPEMAKRWIDLYPDLPAPGGETFFHFCARVHSECNFLREEALLGPILTVTHAGFLKVAIPFFSSRSEAPTLDVARAYASVTDIDC